MVFLFENIADKKFSNQIVTTYCKPTFIRDEIISRFTGHKLVPDDLF